MKKNISQFCPTLSELDINDYTDKLFRTFKLLKHDEVILKDYSAADCLLVPKGQVSVTIGDDSYELTGETETQHIVLKPGKEKLHVTAFSESTILLVDGNEVDDLLAWKEMLNFLEPENEEIKRYASVVRNSQAFHNLPIEKFIDALKKLEPVPVSPGQDVVVQGEMGDAYYYIESGDAEVWATDIYDDEPQLVNKLSSGDAFGEEALVMDGSRSATVKMISDGRLLKLQKDDFLDLMSNPMVNWVKPDEVKPLQDKGYELLDVRYEEEWEDYSIPGATLIPLQSLRQRFGELDKSKNYIAYCKGGARSAVATLLLSQQGFNAVSLTGGIRDWPYDTQSNY